VQLRQWLDQVAKVRVHATTQRLVAEHFTEEQPKLQPRPAGPFQAVLRLERRITRDGMVSVDGNLYSVPDSTRRRVVEVQCTAGEVRILEDGQTVAVHPVLDGRGQRQVSAGHRSVRPPAASRTRRQDPSGGGAVRRGRRAAPAGVLRRRGQAPGDQRSCGMKADTLPAAPIERIRAHLVGLRMPRALETLDHVVQQLERGQIGAIEAIDTLLAEEFTIRESRRVKAALQMARLGTIKTLSAFDFSFQPSLDRNRVLALAQLDFIDRHEVVHFIGQSGTGKSHLAVALGVEAVRAGRSVYFAPLADIIDSLAKAEREGRLRERIGYLCRASLLIIDEIGYLTVGAGAGNLFFQLVNARYEKGAMILTSNRGFAEWGAVFGDPVVATALLDRLLHHAVVVHIEGASYRLRQHADLVPEVLRPAALTSQATDAPRRRGRPPKRDKMAAD
jgi:DNA replication protein DnaC